jgi:catechol 2,3-dioxygenase-like lactoylglutathione lyase family enzyme
MQQKLAMVAIVVDDYDRAVSFYTQKMNFELLEDTVMSPTKRWVVVKPKGKDGCRLLLARAANAEQESRIGNQTGGRVFLFLHTDDFERDYAIYLSNGLSLVREPADESYGRVAVFRDIFGNLWDLIQPSPH